MTYRSKVDWWVGAALYTALVFPVILAFVQRKPFLIAIPLFLLVVYRLVLMPVSYQTLDDVLLIRAGVLKTRIPYSAIHSMRASRNPLSSPALSLDRIEICYGQGSSVLVSPKDKIAFMEDVQGRVSQVGILL